MRSKMSMLASLSFSEWSTFRIGLPDRPRSEQHFLEKCVLHGHTVEQTALAKLRRPESGLVFEGFIENLSVLG